MTPCPRALSSRCVVSVAVATTAPVTDNPCAGIEVEAQHILVHVRRKPPRHGHVDVIETGKRSSGDHHRTRVGALRWAACDIAVRRIVCSGADADPSIDRVVEQFDMLGRAQQLVGGWPGGIAPRATRLWPIPPAARMSRLRRRTLLRTAAIGPRIRPRYILFRCGLSTLSTPSKF